MNVCARTLGCAAIALGLAVTAARALEPAGLLFSNSYPLSTFDGLSGFLMGSNGFRLGGGDEDARFGQTLAAAGDMNGDGRADLAVAAPQMDVPAKFRAGRVYLVPGGSSTLPDQSVALLTNALVFDGAQIDGQAGASIAGGGDFNGDGLSDLAIGVPFADVDGATNAGLVALVYGRTNLPSHLTLDSLDGTHGCIFVGEGAGHQAGSSVAFAGDLNGDGRDDLLVGAPEYSAGTTAQVGRAYLLLGRAGAPATNALASFDGTHGCILTGDDASDRAGAAVASLGDFNGDGRPDAVVGAPTAGPLFEGRAYAVFGRSDWPAAIPLTALDGTNGFRFDGSAFFGAFGESVAGADLNGDGRSDLLAGARGENRAYVLYGTASPAALRAAASLDGTNGFVLATTGGGSFGQALARIGRVNFDDRDDVMVAAPGQPISGFASAGRVYVVLGAPSFSATTDVATLADGANGFLLAGEQTQAEAGRGLAGAGDWDGDGRDDLLVGEWLRDYGAANAGAAYLLSARGIASRVWLRPELIAITRTGEQTVVSWAGQAGVTYDIWTNGTPEDGSWGLAATVASGGATSTWEQAGGNPRTQFRIELRP